MHTLHTQLCNLQITDHRLLVILSEAKDLAFDFIYQPFTLNFAIYKLPITDFLSS